jgi:O-antigen ligase
MMVTAASTIGIALLVVDGVRGRDRIDLVLKTVAVMGGALGVIAATQFLTGFDPTRYMALPGLRYINEELFIFERNGVSRVAATTGHPIEYAVVCAMILPIALHYAFRARERGEPSLRWWICSALIGAGLIFSVSRSAFVGLAGAAVVLLVGWSRARRIGALIGVVVFVAGVKVVAPGVLGAIIDLFAGLSNDSSLAWRTMDYATAADEIAKHLWLGRGFGTWYAPKYIVFDNQYILTAVETGVIGVVTFAGLFVAGFWSALRARYLETDPVLRDIGLTLAACLVVPVIGALTFDLRTYATVTGLSFLLVGTTGALLREAGLNRRAAAAPPSTTPPTDPAR